MSWDKRDINGLADSLFFISCLLFYLCVFVTIFTLIVFWVGVCSAAPPDEVAVDLAVATMVEGVAPTPNPSPYNCATCKDTGWIMHGDGHQTKCPNCDLAKIQACRKGILEYAANLDGQGHALILRSKQILAAADRKGKVPDATAAGPVAGCANGQCGTTAQYRRPTTKKRTSSWRWKR